MKEHTCQGKNLIPIAGLNINISPEERQTFPLTRFVPWGAYIQKSDGTSYSLELEAGIHRMEIHEDV